MLRVYHPDGNKTDGHGRKCFEDDNVYWSPKGLPDRYKGATKYVIDEDVAPCEGAFGDYELDGARGHHTGMRVWVEASTFDRARALYLIMGDRHAARRYQARKAAGIPAPSGRVSDRGDARRHGDRTVVAAAAPVAATEFAPITLRVEVAVTGDVALSGVLATPTLTVPATLASVSANGATATNGNGTNGHNGAAHDDKPPDEGGGTAATAVVTVAVKPVAALRTTPLVNPTAGATMRAMANRIARPAD